MDLVSGEFGKGWRVMMGVVVVLCFGGVVSGQNATVRIQSGPYYAGEPFIIQVTAEGFDENPQPECAVGAALPEGVRVALSSVSPNISTQRIFTNGQLRQFRNVSFVYQFMVTADRAGSFRVGPFELKQGGTVVRTQVVPFDITTVDLDPEMRVALRLPDKPIYPSQRVPVTVEWWYAGDIDNVSKINIDSDFFDAFEFEDPPVERGQSRLPVNSKHGRVELAATAERRTLDGKQYVVVLAERTLIADRVGRFEFGGITANITKVTQWSRDVFGGRRAVNEMRVRAVGETGVVEVKGLPVVGRPASFAGAVGTGFHLKAAADRSVVNVGDPIRLTLELAGSGNLAGASLPRLDAGGEGLVASQFGLPSTEATGVLVDGVKRFEVDIRVKDAGVNQIPPVAYSWFDADKEKYETVYSDPIALAVNAGRVVSAADVVSSTVLVEGGEDAGEMANGNAGGGGNGGGGSVGLGRFDLSGADLAIGQDVRRLLGDDRKRFGGAGVRGVVYGLGILVIGLAWLMRRRAEADPAIAERRRCIVRQVCVIAGAKSLGGREGAAAVADALRQVTAYIPSGDREELDSVLGACDAVSFARGSEGEGGRMDVELQGRALALVKSLSKE